MLSLKWFLEPFRIFLIDYAVNISVKSTKFKHHKIKNKKPKTKNKSEKHVYNRYLIHYIVYLCFLTIKN